MKQIMDFCASFILSFFTSIFLYFLFFVFLLACESDDELLSPEPEPTPAPECVEADDCGAGYPDCYVWTCAEGKCDYVLGCVRNDPFFSECRIDTDCNDRVGCVEDLCNRTSGRCVAAECV